MLLILAPLLGFKLADKFEGRGSDVLVLVLVILAADAGELAATSVAEELDIAASIAELGDSMDVVGDGGVGNRWGGVPVLLLLLLLGVALSLVLALLVSTSLLVAALCDVSVVERVRRV